MQGRYDLAVESLLAVFASDVPAECIEPDLVSEVKGMLNRCLRKDQWDWFSVFTQLGEPARRDMQRLVPLLSAFRRSVVCGDSPAIAKLKSDLQCAGLPVYLRHFQNGGPAREAGGLSGWIYILSTREQPSILKIGMTRRSVLQRVKEINRATGVLIPFSARAVFRVPDAAAAEREVFSLLSEYRIRVDREFFELDFAVAVRLTEEFLSASGYDSASRSSSARPGRQSLPPPA